jgi:hypothetical protein
LNYYNTIVSKFRDKFDTKSLPVRIGDFLTDQSKEILVRNIRAESNKKVRDRMKGYLPAVTVSSDCGTGNRRINAVGNTGLIMLDIDQQHNPNIPDMLALIQYLRTVVRFIWYCGLSASGRGFFCIIPVSDPARHKAHWYGLEAYFKAMLIVVDPEPKSAGSLRYQSWNTPETSWFNHECMVFDQFQVTVRECVPVRVADSTDMVKVERCIQQIEAGKIDICANGGRGSVIAAMAHAFGRDGIDLAYRATQFHATTTMDNTRARLMSFLADGYSGPKVGLGSFFHICKEFGIR